MSEGGPGAQDEPQGQDTTPSFEGRACWLAALAGVLLAIATRRSRVDRWCCVCILAAVGDDRAVGDGRPVGVTGRIPSSARGGATGTQQDGTD